jgi:hypothetical protein
MLFSEDVFTSEKDSRQLARGLWYSFYQVQLGAKD